MSYLGDFAAAVTIDTKFSTFAGAPTTLGGSPAISVYKDNNTAESTSGVTLTADFDSRTGLNHLRIDLSSDGSFYSAGSNFQAVITAGTVGGVSVVGTVVAEFSIRNRSALMPATAGRNLDVDSNGDADISQSAADKVFGSSGAAIAELGVATPSATPSPGAALMLLYMSLRNKLTTTSSVKSIFNNAGTAITTKALSDDGSTYTEAKMS